MITRALMMRLFDGFTIERWNDKIRPFPFIEIDKQTHKMMYAYFFGTLLEEYFNKEVEWDILINCCIYEYIQRLVLTDLKSPFFHYIKNNKEIYKRLNTWITDNFKPYLKGSHKAQQFIDNMNIYLNYNENENEHTKYRALLQLSSTLSTIWEFNIIYKHNRNGFKIKKIRDLLKYDEIKHFYEASNSWDLQYEASNSCDLQNKGGLYVIYNKYNINKLLHLIVELRHQTRWAHLPMYPKTSVLGHMGYVALLTYFITREISIHNNIELDSDVYKERLYNNFYTALFHDLKEVATRDIISPVKNSLNNICNKLKEPDITKKYEDEEFDKIRQLFETNNNNNADTIRLNNLIKLIEDDEFADLVDLKPVDNINYNDTPSNPRDGKLIKAMDLLSACIEAKSSLIYGINNPILANNYNNILDIYDGNTEIKGHKPSELYNYNIYALFKQLI
ncbi:MAG: HD domain-containing protein [Candidatus Coatesbacteria bacterium]|nr:HD domain-containing protein [Candidatus Coatesbacteria bacterium]